MEVGSAYVEAVEMFPNDYAAGLCDAAAAADRDSRHYS